MHQSKTGGFEFLHRSDGIAEFDSAAAASGRKLARQYKQEYKPVDMTGEPPISSVHLRIATPDPASLVANERAMACSAGLNALYTRFASRAEHRRSTAFEPLRDRGDASPKLREASYAGFAQSPIAVAWSEPKSSRRWEPLLYKLNRLRSDDT